MAVLNLTTEYHFGKQLREERLRRKLKQTEVAKKMGCTSDNIGHFEKGDNTFENGSIQTVFKYARALDYNEVNFKL